MAKEGKKKPKEKKTKKSWFPGRKSSVAKSPVAQNGSSDQSGKRKSTLGVFTRKSSAGASASASGLTSSKSKARKAQKQTSKKSGGKTVSQSVISEGTSYDRNKQRRPKKGKKKEKKKKEIIIKRGDVKRASNKYYPGEVSFRYESPPENWVEFLGAKPVVNDYGNGARLLLDETDA